MNEVLAGGKTPNATEPNADNEAKEGNDDDDEMMKFPEKVTGCQLPGSHAMMQRFTRDPEGGRSEEYQNLKGKGPKVKKSEFEKRSKTNGEIRQLAAARNQRRHSEGESVRDEVCEDGVGGVGHALGTLDTVAG